MQACFLGTGGAANERRHQACLLVRWGDEVSGGRLLLDTGNGLDVVRQLVTAGCTPTAVRDIFVSHQHVDHVGGLEPLLLWNVLRAHRESGDLPKLETCVYAEPRVLADIEKLLDAVASVAPRLFGGRLRLVPVSDRATVQLQGGVRLTSFLVEHPPVGGGAMGCVVELDGVRIAYSGDTRPAPRLIETVQDVELLIHEAGGLDNDAAAVHSQGHSTAGDAGRAARAAGVGRLILTHLPEDDTVTRRMLDEARAEFGGPVELANDMVVVAP
jgi:ribonuclease Z